MLDEGHHQFVGFLQFHAGKIFVISDKEVGSLQRIPFDIHLESVAQESQIAQNRRAIDFQCRGQPLASYLIALDGVVLENREDLIKPMNACAGARTV